MDFGRAIHYLKHKQKVARASWNGKYLFLQLGDPKTTSAGLPIIHEITAADHHVPWVATQADMLAMDWELIR